MAKINYYILKRPILITTSFSDGNLLQRFYYAAARIYYNTYITRATSFLKCILVMLIYTVYLINMTSLAYCIISFSMQLSHASSCINLRKIDFNFIEKVNLYQVVFFLSLLTRPLLYIN